MFDSRGYTHPTALSSSGIMCGRASAAAIIMLSVTLPDLARCAPKASPGSKNLFLNREGNVRLCARTCTEGWKSTWKEQENACANED